MSDSTPEHASDSATVKPGDHVFLVDGSSYIFRAYHALPPLTRKSDGLPVGALAGFCNMLWKLLQDASAGVQPTHFAVVFDKSEKTFRNKLYDQYKAHRPDAPEDLVPQFGLIREAVRAFNLPVVEQAGYEADDLIATYARQAEAAGAHVTIVASDKDLMQVVSPLVTMLDTMKDRRIGVDEVIERFGVPPDHVIDVQALAGDSVDNIPGVPGIGVKTAAQLINTYGDLESLLARAGEIKQPKRRQSLIDHADSARMSLQLVTLVTDLDAQTKLDELVVRERDGPLLVAFCKAMEFTALTRRVAAATDTDADVVEAAHVTVKGWASTRRKIGDDVPERPVYRPYFNAPDRDGPAAQESGPASDQLGARVAEATSAMSAMPFDISGYATITEMAELDLWIGEAVERGRVAIDVEATSLDPMQAEIVGISLALEPGRACYVPIGHTSGDDDLLG
ncbi:MAG: 5'-3' exonuclease H3TH domain-containing protein, partial [Alphaproteobacteria bacterium]